MSTSSVQRTAEIIPFPGASRRAAARREPAAREAAPATPVDIDGWYHDAAVQDSRRIGER